MSFFEATTESITQFTIGDIIIRTYGVSDNMVTKFFQLFSLASSMLSLSLAFITVSYFLVLISDVTEWKCPFEFQRQSYLKPMETPNFEKSFKGICCWILWKIGFVVYFLCAAFPIGLCITCIMVLAIERRSTIVLPVILSGMLHPVVVIPIGVVSKTLEGYLSSKLFKTHINKRTWK